MSTSENQSAPQSPPPRSPRKPRGKQSVPISVFLADGPGAVESVQLQFDQIYLISIDGAEDGRLVELRDRA